MRFFLFFSSINEPCFHSENNDESPANKLIIIIKPWAHSLFLGYQTVNIDNMNVPFIQMIIVYMSAKKYFNTYHHFPLVTQFIFLSQIPLTCNSCWFSGTCIGDPRNVFVSRMVDSLKSRMSICSNISPNLTICSNLTSDL